MSFMSNRIWQLTNTVLLHAHPCLMNCHTCHTSSRFSFPYTYGIKVPISSLFPAYFSLFQKRRKSRKPHINSHKSCCSDPISALFDRFSVIFDALEPRFGQHHLCVSLWPHRLSKSFIPHPFSGWLFSFRWGILKSDAHALPKTFFRFSVTKQAPNCQYSRKAFREISNRLSNFSLPIASIVGG